MCLIVASLGQDPRYPLVVAANRDEFFQRPTRAMHWWPGRNLLAGLDEKSGGTWLAITPGAAVAAVTNVREGSAAPGSRSRGELPLMALETPEDELESYLRGNQDAWPGFNLVNLTPRSGWYFSNRDVHPGRHLERGIFGLSNHLLQTPWPKLLRLREGVSRDLSDHGGEPTERLHQTLIGTLRDDTPAPDEDLPDTGVGLETERFLSSPFIVGEAYGTRTTTIVTLDASGEVLVTEQAWLPEGIPGEQQQFRWQKQ